MGKPKTSYIWMGAIVAFIILAIVFISHNSSKNVISNIDSFKLTSINWSCNTEVCAKNPECGALFTFKIVVNGNQQDKAYCRPFIDGNPFQSPNDVYSLNGNDKAGIPSADPFTNHLVKVCCNTNFINFQKGEYQVCNEILLNKFCEINVSADNTLINESNLSIVESSSKCWNKICEQGETWENCADCQIPCQSEFCNSKTTLFCDNCTELEYKLLPTVFEYQNIIYDCIANFLGSAPERRFRYWIKPPNTMCPNNVVHCENVGNAGYSGVFFPGIPGIVNSGEFEVNSTENVRADIHETTHVFTDNLLRNVPDWYNEGVSIYLNEKLNCHPKQYEDTGNRLTIALNKTYYQLKNGTEPEFFEYPHYKGSLFFAGLELDYGCKEICFKEIFNKLREIKESRNSMGPGETIISNSDIKQAAEEVTNKDLSKLFDLLELKY